ncbi:MAG: hypothetical protein Fur0037_19540 [Planctomycetota bacterium]
MRRGNWSVQELERLRSLLPRRGVEGTARLLRRSPDSVRRKAHDLFAADPARGPWTADDDALLRRSWGALEPRLIALMLSRTSADVLRRAAWMRDALRSGPWSRREIGLLKELYGTRSDEDLEVALSRSREDIRRMAETLCLAKDKRFHRGAGTAGGRSMPRWTADQVEALRDLYPHMDNLEVARRLGRTVASVANKAHQLGLRKKKELLARIGRRNVIARYTRGAEPPDAAPR